jgi:tetratricopeptide (TPR) repeat protein
MMRTRTLACVAICVLLALDAGCSIIHLPRSITEGDATPKRKKRSEECVRQLEQQRDLAEYEAAKGRWVQQRDAKGCREGLEMLLARKPQHRDARLLMVELLLTENDSRGAYQHAKAALDACPNDAQVRYVMGVVKDAQGKNAEALAFYEQANEMEPGNETYAVAYQTAAEATHEESQAEKPTNRNAQSAERRSSAAKTKAAGDIAGRLDALNVTGAQTDKRTGVTLLPPPAGRSGSSGGADSAGSARTSDVDPAEQLLRKGQKAIAKGSTDEALEFFRQAAAANPDNPQIPISAAASALRANQPEVAVELLRPASKQFPKSAAVHRALGAAYYRTGDLKSSQVALQQALSLDKSSALSYLLLGCTLAKLGQNEAAETHFRQARTLDSKYRVVR